MTSKACWWCGDEATRLCDALIGAERRLDKTIILDESYTCDALICDRCTKQVGHVCGEEPDSLDRCPAHVDHTFNHRTAATSATEADGVRSAIRAKAMRGQMTVVAASTQPTADGGDEEE